MSNQFTLMKESRFRPFFFTQFLGAFNDNVFKTALITLIAFHSVTLARLDSSTLTTLLPGLFILPFFLFSATAGQIADKFEKSRIIRYVKIFEFCIMIFATVGFFLHQIWLLVVVLFMMGVHSTIFGPVKYSYLPQHLNESELIGGNGMVEMGSFMAILLGQLLGAWLTTQTHNEILTSITILIIASLGYWSSCSVPNSPAADESLEINWNPITETVKNIKFIYKNKTIMTAIIGISWFWFYGATLLAQFPTLSKVILHGDEELFILLLTVFSLGIGIGSLLCEKLSKTKIEVGLVLFGAFGLTLFGADLYLSSNTFYEGTNIEYFSTGKLFISLKYVTHLQLINIYWRLLIDIIFIGIFGGIYIVPLYTLIQTRSESSHQSRVFAANNILNALFMVLSAGMSVFLISKGITIPQLFFITAILNVIVTIYLCMLQPEFIITFISWIKS